MKEQLLQVLVPVVGTVLTAAITWGGAKLVTFIQAKTKNEFLKGALVRLEQAVQTAVLEVQQTYVEYVKAASADGKLTFEEAREAKARAILAAKTYLGRKGLLELAKVLGFTDGALDLFLGGKVEAMVAGVKLGEATAPATADPQLAPAAA
jgi:hypothetical protein